MRRLLTTGLLLSAMTAFGQPRPTIAPDPSAPLSESTSTDLPDAPGADQAVQENVVVAAKASFKQTGNGAHPCGMFSAMKLIYVDPSRYDQVPKPCSELIYPYQRFLTSNIVVPMTWEQKGYLALHDLADPANFGTILGISAITVGADSHSAYGPGMKGFGKSVGVSLLQDATAQFFGEFAIPVLTHQDPRYFRIPHAPVPKRILYAVSRSVISRSDSGRSMPNYATLFSYPIEAELANFYVPGIHPDAASTGIRILTGYGLDPVNNLLNEFLPDVASRVHVRVIFVQRILNNVATSNGGATLP
ncbi:MAG TPA: hypothetical protein VNY74_13435 [Edaphobacter sp.]|nr:hypothetical protein [Edaphobacter sp.]